MRNTANGKIVRFITLLAADRVALTQNVFTQKHFASHYIDDVYSFFLNAIKDTTWFN